MSKIDKDGTENREALIIKRGKNMILLNSGISKQLVKALKETYPDIILEIKIL